MEGVLSVLSKHFKVFSAAIKIIQVAVRIRGVSCSGYNQKANSMQSLFYTSINNKCILVNRACSKIQVQQLHCYYNKLIILRCEVSKYSLIYYVTFYYQISTRQVQLLLNGNTYMNKQVQQKLVITNMLRSCLFVYY